jgi:hypothetical protein
MVKSCDKYDGAGKGRVRASDGVGNTVSVGWTLN